MKKKEISQDLEKNLIKRIEALEKKLESLENKEEKTEKKSSKKIVDSMTETGDKIIKESGKILSSITDATAEGMKEGLNIFTSNSEEKDKEKLGEISSAVLGVFRKTLDVQKKILDKFEESYKNYKD